jgi:hypothetical protein
VIRVLVATGLALAAAGCSAGGAGEPAPFVAEPPPTVAPAPAGSSAPVAEEPLVTKPVAPGALLSPADLGEGWTKAAPVPVPCRVVLPVRPTRSAGLKDGRGTLTETVSSGIRVTSGVAAWRRALTGCGWAVSPYGLGDAGLSATSGSGRVVVTGTEGVLLVLHASGGLAGASDEMDSWADMALGTSCVAAPDGCH